MTAGGALLVAAAVVHLLWNVRIAWLARASAGWPSTTGVVQRAYVDESLGDEDGNVSYIARVHYSYSVRGQRYASRRLSYRWMWRDRSTDVVEMLRGRTEGREVEVRYDPRSPARAVLFPGSGPHDALRLGFAAALCVWAVWSAL